MRRTSTGWEFTERTMRTAMFIFTIVGGTFSIGVSYAASRFALDDKLDERTFLLHENAFNLHVQDEQSTLEQLLDAQARQTQLLETLNNRVRIMYCEGKPAGCA